MKKINIAFDMETSDPDDVFTLCFLASHPQVNLISVTVTPGSKQQIGLVKLILDKLELNIPIGSKNPSYEKDCVSQFHYNWLGKIASVEDTPQAKDILKDALEKYPDVTIVCGAPLGNLGALIDVEGIKINKVVIQGGFAGDNVMEPWKILEKFKGRITCPTFNLNGDVKSSLKILDTDKIDKKYFVSKNICHGVVYDKDLHEWCKKYQGKSKGLDLLIEGMEYYLSYKSGKIFHDPLAACAAINEQVCVFTPVVLFREKGEWGSKISNSSNTFISTSVSMDQFKKTLVGVNV